MEGLFSFGPFLINLKGPRLNCLSPRATSERVPLLNLSLLLSGPLTCAQRRNSAWISSARLCELRPHAVDIFHGFNLCLAENKQQCGGTALGAVSWLAGWLAVSLDRLAANRRYTEPQVCLSFSLSFFFFLSCELRPRRNRLRVFCAACRFV